MIFYVPLERRKFVIEAMKDSLYIPFEFENEGTRVIHYIAENYEPLEEGV